MELYDQVLNEVRQFLPRGEDVGRFVERQCRLHLKIEPSALRADHLPELARWISVSIGLLIPKEKAALLRQNIERLG